MQPGRAGRYFREVQRREFLRLAGAGLAGLGTGLGAGAAGAATSSSVDGIFELGDLVLECGRTLREAKIAYRTHGVLNADGSNAVLYPTPYSAHHGDIEWLIGPGRALDPARYFIIVADMLGNGLSSSPSNTAPPQDRARFPAVSIRDNVAAQHALVTRGLSVARLALVVGWSMGAQQSYQWAVSHPSLVERVAAFCGTARTTPHNLVFLEGLRAALTADAAWQEGWYERAPARGLRAFARVYAGWGFSQPFYRQELFRGLGFSSLEDFLVGFWERRFLRRDANNLLTMLDTWAGNDVGATPGFGGSLERALGSIRARTLVMPGQTDLYFTPEDCERDARLIPGARFQVIPSVWGHQAGNGLNAADASFISAQIRTLLEA